MNHIDWKALAIEALRNYPARKASIGSIPEEIKMLEGRMVAPRGGASADSIPVREGGNRYEERLLTDIAKKSEMEKALGRAKTEVARVEEALVKLTDEQRLLLDRFYMNRTKDYMERLCEELGYERTQVYKKKDDALYEFTLRMYGVIEI